MVNWREYSILDKYIQDYSHSIPLEGVVDKLVTFPDDSVVVRTTGSAKTALQAAINAVEGKLLNDLYDYLSNDKDRIVQDIQFRQFFPGAAIQVKIPYWNCWATWGVYFTVVTFEPWFWPLTKKYRLESKDMSYAGGIYELQGSLPKADYILALTQYLKDGTLPEGFYVTEGQ